MDVEQRRPPALEAGEALPAGGRLRGVRFQGGGQTARRLGVQQLALVSLKAERRLRV
jgi:hypothetical protein